MGAFVYHPGVRILQWTTDTASNLPLPQTSPAASRREDRETEDQLFSSLNHRMVGDLCYEVQQ